MEEGSLLRHTLQEIKRYLGEYILIGARSIAVEVMLRKNLKQIEVKLHEKKLRLCFPFNILLFRSV